MRRAPLLLAAGLLLAACGLPDDESYTAIQPDALPVGMADTTTTSTTTTTTVPATTTTTPEATTTTSTIPTQPVQLFFVANGRLQPVVRAWSPLPVAPLAVAQALQLPPTPQDQPPGLRTAIFEGTIDNVTVTGGVATVELDPAFIIPAGGADQAQVPNVDQPLAFGQIVLTLTSLPGIGQVRFTVAGQPQGALVAGGSLVDVPVSGDNYASLRAA